MKRIPESSRHPNPFPHTSPCTILSEPVLNRRYGFCRYRITEGSEEIQMRKVAGFLFGYMGPGWQLKPSVFFRFSVTCELVGYGFA
jgi:hypothetical protein